MTTNGYTIYVGGQRRDWIVRVYRDADDQHIHSAESCFSIRVGLDEAHRAIVHDLDKSSAAPPAGELAADAPGPSMPIHTGRPGATTSNDGAA